MAQVVPMPQVQRVPRRPQHTFQLRVRPFVIQPFLIAPVLPGETMKSLLLQSRVVTDPIKNSIIGWWQEYYVFYVKHRDLDERDILTNMMLSFGTSVASIQEAADVQYHHGHTAINWAKLCLKRVVKEYFRLPNENWDAFMLDGMPLAKINLEDWTESMIDETLLTEGGGTTTGETMEDLDRLRMQYDFMKANQMVNMDYEDFLRTYGVRKNRAELHKPELIRYVRDWTYPSNTIDPATGTPSSACSWAVSERADKDRYFTEPGFIFGVAVTRPKVYRSRVQMRSCGVSMLEDAFGWLPAIMRDDPGTSLKQFAAGAGPIAGTTNGYWIDQRDLYLYGDQFINHNSDGKRNRVGLPTATQQTKYVADADVDGLFVDPAADKQYVWHDGAVSLSILGTQKDHT